MSRKCKIRRCPIAEQYVKLSHGGHGTENARYRVDRCCRALVVSCVLFSTLKLGRADRLSCRLEKTYGRWSNVAQLAHIETSCERDADGQCRQTNVIYVACNIEKAVSITESGPVTLRLSSCSYTSAKRIFNSVPQRREGSSLPSSCIRFCASEASAQVSSKLDRRYAA